MRSIATWPSGASHFANGSGAALDTLLHHGSISIDCDGSTGAPSRGISNGTPAGAPRTRHDLALQRSYCLKQAVVQTLNMSNAVMTADTVCLSDTMKQ
jgi:hypothetical protein